MANVIDEVYCHIGNGGVTFAVEDTGYGPEVVVRSTHFGNNVCEKRVMVDPRVLARLRDLFDTAARHAEEGRFSETYCHAADYRLPEEFGGVNSKDGSDDHDGGDGGDGFDGAGMPPGPPPDHGPSFWFDTTGMGGGDPGAGG